MATPISEAMRRQSEAQSKVPNLILEIDGVTDKFGAVTILKYVRVGDPDLFIGDDWIIGGKTAITDQQSVITFDGTSTSISQKMDTDKASGSTVPQMQITLVDVDESITQLITPGEVVTDILGRDATVWLGFGAGGFPEDYIRVHRGIIDDITSYAGRVTFQISHPDQNKRQKLFLKANSKLAGAITDSASSLILAEATNFLTRILGPDGTYDPNIEYGLRIDDEIMFYTGISGTTFSGLTRGQLGTTASAHSDQADVESFIKIGGNAMDLALKIMLSQGTYYETGVTVSAFNSTGLETLENAIFFSEIDVSDVYGVVIGDYVTTVSATNGANNVTLMQVTDVEVNDFGSYVIVDGVSFVDEPVTSATVSFRSQYDTLAAGLAMHNKEVDIEQHELIKRRFLASFEYEFYIRDDMDAKDFIESELYFPSTAYSIPRKARSSVGYHIGPLPDTDIKILDATNVVNASQIAIRRSMAKNFFNTIVYKYEESALDGDKFFGGEIIVDEAAKTQTNDPGTKALVIPSKGMRAEFSAQNLAIQGGNKRLKRYRVGAEYIDGIQLFLSTSFNMEIGDICLLDMESLQISDSKQGTRAGKPRLFEVYNKAFDLKTGQVKLSLIDTNYSTDKRYGLVSPSSRCMAGCTTTRLKLKISDNNPFGSNEGKKWSRFLGLTVKVRNDDFSNSSKSVISSVSGNTVVLSPALSFTPAENDIIQFGDYNDMTGKIGDKAKLIYAWMRDSDFDDGTHQYDMI